MPISWIRDGDTLYGVLDGGGQYYMVVEPLPDQSGWDWLIWPKWGPPESASRGLSQSLIDAEAEAEARVTAAARTDRLSVEGPGVPRDNAPARAVVPRASGR
jgi:hypothetical protein